MNVGGATLVEKRIDMDKFHIVKCQIIFYCFVNKIKLNDTEHSLLALIGETGKIRLTEFCELAVKRNILGSPQAVSVCLSNKMSNLIVKEGTGKKMISLSPVLKIVSEGNIVINLRLVKLETAKSRGNIQNHSAKVELA